VSTTPDPTGEYYRYAFVTQPDPDLPGGTFFPDYPKYGVWTDSYIMTTRDFGEIDEYGISVYALEKAKMISATEDNADLRLTEKGHAIGLVSEARYARVLEKRRAWMSWQTPAGEETHAH